jgi:hypothetical protein
MKSPTQWVVSGLLAYPPSRPVFPYPAMPFNIRGGRRSKRMVQITMEGDQS